MTKRSGQLLITGALLISLSLLVAWFFKNHQAVEKEMRTGMSKQARSNDLLAAEFFLNNNGIPAESRSGRDLLIDLPPTQDTLLISDLGASLNQERLEALLQWMRGGGHILTTANRYWDEDSQRSGNRLLDELNIRLVTTESLLADEDESDEATNAKQQRPETEDGFSKLLDNAISTIEHDPVDISLENGERIKLHFNGNRSLQDIDGIAHYSAGGAVATHVLDINVGEGRLTVFSDNEFMQNPIAFVLIGRSLEKYHNSIADHDNAYFLWYILGSSKKVWLMYSIDAPELSELLWAQAYAACISFIVLLLFWLWWQRNRFGPLHGKLDPPRRNLLEHLLMSANYAWRQDKAQRLFAQNREHIKQGLIAKHPQLRQLSPEEQCLRLAELSELSQQQAHQALYSDWRSERELIQLTHLLQKLRTQI